jgi:hypothetical protein
VPAGKLDKPIDFNTVDDNQKDDYLKNQEDHLADLEDIPHNMKGLADSFM